MSLSKTHVFLVYTVIIALHALINTYGVRLLAQINNISAWWHMAGVLVIVGVLIVVPDHHKSVSFVFTDTENFSGFSGHSFASPCSGSSSGSGYSWPSTRSRATTPRRT